MSKIYAISCEDFASQEGNFDILVVDKGIVYINSDKELKKPYTLSGLPEDVRERLDKELEIAKEQKKQEINDAKIKAIESSVELDGKKYQATEYDRNLLTSTISLFNISNEVPENFVWIAEDNTSVPFTFKKLMQLANLMATNVQVQTIKARTLKDKLESATTIDEVNAIRWE